MIINNSFITIFMGGDSDNTTEYVTIIIMNMDIFTKFDKTITGLANTCPASLLSPLL